MAEGQNPSSAMGVCLSVCLSVCYSTLGCRAQTAGPIVTKPSAGDAPMRGNDFGAGPGWVGRTCRAARAARQTLAQNFGFTLQVKRVATVTRRLVHTRVPYGIACFCGSRRRPLRGASVTRRKLVFDVAPPVSGSGAYG